MEKNIINHDMQKLDNEDSLFIHIAELIDNSRKQVIKAVNTTMVYTYYEIGQYIIEFEQGGNTRAMYGKEVLARLSCRLNQKYGNGWSVETLTKCRKFFAIYGISSTAQTKSQEIVHSGDEFANGVDSFCTIGQIHKFVLSWNHYQILMRIQNPQERSFYEIEAYNQNWSVRQLQRQYASSLYERLALSRNKDEVLRLANEGQTMEKPSDLIKNPFVMEFIGLKPDSSYSESKLESAVISKMEEFLLECGKGFLFEARQKRFTFDEDNFFVDLVLYNRILQCYVLIDFKTDKITHQDLGQMQMYVNYFDRYKRLDFEKPTIGILLCKEKNDALVELTLPSDANIYAQQYALCLPDKLLLKQKLKEWFEEYDNLTEKE